MATIAEPKVGKVEGERRFVIYDVGWEGYQTLLGLVGDRPIRLTYDRGNVELMSPLLVPERYRNRLGFMVETITEELDIPRIGGGATTFNREDEDRGLEPDECYYLANAERIRGRERVDLTVDPPPDLAIDVEITHGVLNRLGIYAKLGIPEVWRFDGETLSVLLLGDDGTYAPSATSAAFPFLPMDEVSRFVREGEPDDTRWGKAFRAWVRDVLVPRARGADDRPDQP
jgi:Uma2 family endonuclease